MSNHHIASFTLKNSQKKINPKNIANGISKYSILEATIGVVLLKP